jgi:hypothetical protein
MPRSQIENACCCCGQLFGCALESSKKKILKEQQIDY